MMTSARGGAYDSSKHLRHQTALQNLPLDASWDHSNYSEINKANQKEASLSPYHQELRCRVPWVSSHVSIKMIVVHTLYDSEALR